MRTGRAFRPDMNGLEPRIVMDHGISASAATLRALANVKIESQSPKVRIASRPTSLAGNVANRVQYHFDQFASDIADSREQFVAAYLPVSAAATTTTAAAQADAANKMTLATTAKSLANTAANDLSTSQMTLITANSAAAKAKALYDIAVVVSDDAVKTLAASQNDPALKTAAKSAANAAALDAANKKADADSAAATAAIAAAQVDVRTQQAKTATANAATATAASNDAATLLAMDTQADLNASSNTLTIATYQKYITQRTQQLSQELAGDLLLLVGSSGAGHTGHRPALIPNSLTAYISKRISDPSIAVTNTSLLRQLIVGLPDSRATSSTISQLASTQNAAIAAARNAIYNGTLLIKFNRTGRAPKH